jgi:hypothetical protein
MGIDIYAHWKGQTRKEKEAQYTGFSVVHGHTGYLREAYHGEPYATRYLCQEAFESATGEAQIPAKLLRKRLKEAHRLTQERHETIYHEEQAFIDQVKKSFTDFVELAERKEKETGSPVTIIASY